jgi:hypothetical protein
MHKFLSDAELNAMETMCKAATPGPWRSYVEGRDHTSGSNFVMTGEGGEDFELSSGGTLADQDFIAAARQDVPRLIAEVRALRELVKLNDKTQNPA